MSWDSGGDIDNGARVTHVDDGDIHVTGKIDNASFAELVSVHGSITIDGKVDASSYVSLRAAGDIRIGVVGGDGDKKIDGGSQVIARSDGGSIVLGNKVGGGSSVSLESDQGSITITDKIDGSNVSLRAKGDIQVGVKGDKVVDGGSQLRAMADGSITLGDKVDHGTTVDLVSNLGSITIHGKVDGESLVSLIAAGDIAIGVGTGGDFKIDGNSHVDATAGGDISLGNWIHGDRSTVDFNACGDITIGDEIGNGATVRLMTATGSISVSRIGDSNTHVTVWPAGSLTATGGIHDGASVATEQWARQAVGCSEPPRLTGYWWQNWPQTFGYVSPLRAYPRSLEEIVQAVGASGPVGTVPIPGPPLKAVGGGWSFTDAALPFRTKEEVDEVSTQMRGAWRTRDMQKVLQGLNFSTGSPMDLMPAIVGDDLAFSRHWDQASLTQRTDSGAVLPGSTGVRLIDTRSLASSLQCELRGILSASAKRRRASEAAAGRHLFHVEAGITIEDLDHLLDHQHPRMALGASGGSPGATLAGTISTATHGGEFQWSLLVDNVRAIHLVGPGGEEWWIEGEESIADPVKLHDRYPKLDAAHFVGGAWNGIPGLTANDVLHAVTVSMGTMGVIYSVVLEVREQFGLQQIVTCTSWAELLSKAGITEDMLRSGDPAANQALLGVILDGATNGTGIPVTENVYADLAINPVNRDCWITNRRVTPLPVDSNSPATSMGDYLTALSTTLSSHAVDRVKSSHAAGRIFDFLGYATDIPENVDDLLNDVKQIQEVVGFLTRFPDILTAGAAMISAQAVANIANTADRPDRGQQFIGDVLTGFLHALQGTSPGFNSDRTDISYKVGAIGWPDGGIPGRGVEIAMDSSRAFSFLQNVLLDDVIDKTVIGQNKPLFGYISIRVCPQTRTLMGMQQYAPYSVMTEVVAYRSPEANLVMNLIQEKVLQMNRKERLQAMLHWGLENQLLVGADLPLTPLGGAIGPSSSISKLEAFKSVRKFLSNGHQPVFDNHFTARLDL